jgi:hypothetical protein
MRRFLRRCLRFAPLSVLLAGTAGAYAADPDWPCPQRLVPTLTAGTYWAGAPPPPGADWHDDPAIAALVAAVVPRTVTAEEGTQKLSAFAAPLAPAERAPRLAEVFAGLVDETNRERAMVIERIRKLGHRQNALAGKITEAAAEAARLPADTHDLDTEQRREDAERRHDLLLQGYRETQRSLGFLCAVPTALESRLGAYAGVLQNPP